jgi:hypothetical protein
VIAIKYNRGVMTIYPEHFFPASQADIKKLLKVVVMADHSQEVIDEITGWMKQEIPQCEELAKEYANKYIDNHPRVKEAEVRIKVMETAANRMRGTQAHKLAVLNLKEARREYNHLKGLEISYSREFKQNSVRKEKLKKNLQVMLS